MSKSFLLGGVQSINASPLTKGQSIIDECLNWEDKVDILDIFANAKAETELEQFSTVA